MNLINLDYISVGEHRYAINLFNPLDGLEWGNRVLALLGPGAGTLIEQKACRDLQNQAGRPDKGTAVFDAVISRLGIVLAGLDALHGKALGLLQKEAIMRCCTPSNKPLNNPGVFYAWFRQHPGDLHQLGWVALYRLVRDFFSEGARYRDELIPDAEEYYAQPRISTPNSWYARALVSRVVNSGACTYPDVVNDNLSMHDLFNILQMLDWNDYIIFKTQENAKKIN